MLRSQFNLTQQEFANKAGISRSHLGNLEMDRSSPSIETIENILEPFGLSYIDFIFNYFNTEEPCETEEYYTLFDLLNEENQKQATDFVEFLISKQRSK